MSGYNPSDTIIFLHIPKTAGKSLRNVLIKQYWGNKMFYFYPNPTSEELEALRHLTDEKDVKVVLGHYRYGVHEYLRRPYTYLTFIRNPIDQVISHYYHLVRSDKEVHQRIIEKNRSLRSFADFEWAKNLQTAFITGTQDVREIEKDPEGALTLAKKRLSEDIYQFGVTEKFDESLLLFREKLGWKNLVYQRFNVAKNRPENHQLNDEDLLKIRKNNQLDLRLYEFGRALFDQRIQQIPGFAGKLKTFRQMNKIAQPYLKTKDLAKNVLTNMHLIKR